MASLCCEPRQSSASVRWQPAQVSLPTKVATETADAFPADLSSWKSWKPTPMMTVITTAIDAAIQILRFDRRPASVALAGRSRAGVVFISPTDRFLDPPFAADSRRLRVNVAFLQQRYLPKANRGPIQAAFRRALPKCESYGSLDRAAHR